MIKYIRRKIAEWKSKKEFIRAEREKIEKIVSDRRRLEFLKAYDKAGYYYEMNCKPLYERVQRISKIMDNVPVCSKRWNKLFAAMKITSNEVGVNYERYKKMSHIQEEKREKEMANYRASQTQYVIVNSKQKDNSFANSAIIGAVTNSGIAGGLLGGDIIGGIAGDLFNGGLND